MSQPNTFKYHAFLSYAHADERAAKRLHRQLESFHIDKSLVGQATPVGVVGATLRPIFRDREDFSGGHELTAATIAAIETAAALIVLCSPIAAMRPAVDEEVKLFRARHPDRPIIPVILDGTPPDNFPPALRKAMAADGTLTDVTILAPDLREDKDGWSLGLAKIVAGITGLRTDEVFRRAERRRRRVLRAWVAGLSMVIATLAGLTVWAKINQQWAESERDRALTTQSRFLADLANQMTARGDAGSAMLLAAYGLPRAGSPRPYVPEAEEALYGAWQQMRELRVFSGHKEPVWAAAISPDGSRIAGGSDDKTALLWDAQGGAPPKALTGHTDRVAAVTFSADSTRLVTSSLDGTARIWDARSGALLLALKGHQGQVRQAVIDARSGHIITGSEDGTVKVWDAATGTVLRTYAASQQSAIRPILTSVALGPNGSAIAAGGLDGLVHLWDVATGAETLLRPEGVDTRNFLNVYVTSVAFSPDGKTIAAGAADKVARLWDVASGKQLRTFEGHGSGIESVAFSSDGRLLLTASVDRTARLWDAKSGALLTALAGHSGGVHSAAFSADGQRIVTASDDGTVRLWRASKEAAQATFADPDSNSLTASLSPDGSRAAVGYSTSFNSRPGVARIWDTSTGKLVSQLNGHSGSVVRLAYSRDGKRLITGSLDKTARVWDAVTGALLFTLAGDVEMTSVAIAQNRAATAETNGSVRIWDLDLGELVRTINAGTHVDDVALSPDGRDLVIPCIDGGVAVIDLSNSNRKIVSPVCARRVSFSPSGEWLGMILPDGAARVVNLKDGRHVVLPKLEKLGFNAITFSEDGSKAVTASNWVAVWDLAQGKVIARLTHDEFGFSEAMLNRDATAVLAVTARRAELRPTFVRTSDLTRAAMQKVPRCLAPEQAQAAFLDASDIDEVCPEPYRTREPSPRSMWRHLRDMLYAWLALASRNWAST